MTTEKTVYENEKLIVEEDESGLGIKVYVKFDNGRKSYVAGTNGERLTVFKPFSGMPGFTRQKLNYKTQTIRAVFGLADK